MPKKKKVFLDASVLIAAAASPGGGSSLVLEVCRGHNFYAATTRKVLLEAQRNIRKKLSRDILLNFYNEIANLKSEIVNPATQEELTQHNDIITTKDRHVIASAIKSNSNLLITLDRKHFQTEAIKKENLSVIIMTPKEFLAWVKEKYKNL
jgi:putative PIN family toxin of toxin-antitoxin system